MQIGYKPQDNARKPEVSMVLSVASVLLLCASANAASLGDEFYEDFRRGGRFSSALGVFGPDAKRFMSHDAQGLRIVLPAERKNRSAVGVSPRVPISGDFEITAAYQILGADRPASGYGVGVKLWLKLDSPKLKTATLSHLIREGGESVLVADHGFVDDEDKQRHRNKMASAKSNSGALRLVRAGGVIHYLTSDGKNEFLELYQAPVGAEDVFSLRLSANTSDTPTRLDVRLIDLRVRAESLGGARSIQRGMSTWLFWLAVSVAAGVLLAGGLAMARRVRTRQLDQPVPTAGR